MRVGGCSGSGWGGRKMGEMQMPFVQDCRLHMKMNCGLSCLPSYVIDLPFDLRDDSDAMIAFP